MFIHDMKLHDILPQPAPPLPTHIRTSLLSVNTSEEAVKAIRMSLPMDMTLATASTSSPVFDTPMNSFGVFRQYYHRQFPNHDPENNLDLGMLSNIADVAQDTVRHEARASPPLAPAVLAVPEQKGGTNTSTFYPYPNETSFLLGDWYWSQGSQKSLADFKNLIEIIASKHFSPDDITSTNWDRINRDLALNDWDKREWEEEDAGWHRTVLTVKIPFPYTAKSPGVHEYTVKYFYHKSLTEVITEKLTNLNHARHFHYEPYKLFWKPAPDAEAIHLQGELYNSPTFMKAHRELQESAGEPGCTLPRVVVGLMFWSDATHLTQFGNTKLWPLYMFFGNESKYRRCKPSCNTCEHVAYFEEVC